MNKSLDQKKLLARATTLKNVALCRIICITVFSSVSLLSDSQLRFRNLKACEGASGMSQTGVAAGPGTCRDMPGQADRDGEHVGSLEVDR